MLIVGFVATASSCVQHRYEPLNSELGKALVYAEQYDGGWSVHSQSDWTMPNPVVKPPGPADRTPSPALIDIDSKLHVYIDKSRVGLGHGGRSLDAAFESVSTQRQEFEALLAKIERVTLQRQIALDAFRSGAEDFISPKRAFGAAEDELIGLLEDHPRFDEIDEAASSAEFVYEGLRTWFAGEVASLNAAYSDLEKQVEAESVTLRMEAWLIQGNRQVPVHMPGYDTLEEGRIRLSDRWGLDLSEAEQQRLNDEIAATWAAVERANQVLEGEKKLVEALAETFSEELSNAIKRVDALIRRFNRGQLRDRLAQLETSSKDFWDSLEDKAAGLTGEARQELEALPEEFKSWMSSEAASIQRALDLLHDLSALRDRWANLTFAEFATTYQATANAWERVKSLSWPALVTDARNAVATFLEGQAGEFSMAASGALADVRASQAGQDFMASVQEIYGDLREALNEVDEIGQDLKQVVDTARGQNITLTSIPETLHLPVNELKDTEIDLRRTARVSGDFLTVRATRSRDGKLFDRSTAEFQVRRFGWYAELSPAVVLVRPRKLAGGNDGYRFAPTLSWLHHYVPRPEDRGDWINSLQPALGLHAAFLNFDTGTSDSVQVGLGATFALWDGRLQAGTGYNFMADSNDEGRVYYFVGTDLIGLLQSVGVVK